MDTVSVEQRSRVMAKVKGRDTAPELAVRSIVHRLGLRFRLCRRDLPGCPDLVLPRHRCVIFVHGCFWHRHEGCPQATMPTSNVRYWRKKFNRNKARDARVVLQLRQLGWRILTIWECQTKTESNLQRLLKKSLRCYCVPSTRPHHNQ